MNVGHFLDHFFILIFATAALHLPAVWELSYAELIPYATPGFIAFAVGALPAGWLADRWSREGMMVLFFIGIGASAILAGQATDILEMSLYLTLMGLFASIYHPVGLAIVVQSQERIGWRVAINSIFGNLGVASAAMVTGLLVDTAGWQSAFWLPGLLSVAVGLAYLYFIRRGHEEVVVKRVQAQDTVLPLQRKVVMKIFIIVLVTSSIGGFIFQSTTFSLPKILDERLVGIAGTNTLVGSYAFLVFAIAALGQLLIGYLLDSRSLRTVFLGVASLQMLCFIWMVGSEGLTALGVAVVFMLAVFAQVPINDLLVGRIAHSSWRSRAYALRSVISFSVMASAIPLIAWIYGNWGFDLLFGVLAVAASLTLLAVWMLPESEQVSL